MPNERVTRSRAADSFILLMDTAAPRQLGAGVYSTVLDDLELIWYGERVGSQKFGVNIW